MLARTADVILCVALAAALLLDLKFRRVPNVLTMSAIIAGVVLAGAASTRDAASRLGLVLLVLIAGFAVFAAGILGGGDVKLIAAVAALKGGDFLLSTLIIAAILGLVAAILVLAHKRKLFAFLGRLGSSFALLLRGGVAPSPVVAGEAHTMPYALVLALAGLVALFCEHNGILPSRAF